MLGFHGCEFQIAEAVVRDGIKLVPSLKENEWLGGGVYFFVGSVERAKSWAIMKKARRSIQRAAVLQMKISSDSGLCLDLTDPAQAKLLKSAFLELEKLCASAGLTLPKNVQPVDGILVNRKLDCAVIDLMHYMRRLSGESEYQAVIGAFEEGPPLYDGSALREQTHLQIAVRDYNCLSEPSLAWAEEVA